MRSGGDRSDQATRSVIGTLVNSRQLNGNASELFHFRQKELRAPLGKFRVETKKPSYLGTRTAYSRISTLSLYVFNLVQCCEIDARDAVRAPFYRQSTMSDAANSQAVYNWLGGTAAARDRTHRSMSNMSTRWSLPGSILPEACTSRPPSMLEIQAPRGKHLMGRSINLSNSINGLGLAEPWSNSGF